MDRPRFGAVFGLICFTQFGLCPGLGRLPVPRGYGWGYYVYIAGIVGLYSFLIHSSGQFQENQQASWRLPRNWSCRVWVFGAAPPQMTISILGAMAPDAVMRNRWMGTEAVGGHFGGQRIFIHVQPLLVLAFYAGTAFAITTNRIFDATPDCPGLSWSRIILMAVVVALLSLGMFQGLTLFLTPPVALLPTVIVALICAALLRSRLDPWFKFYAQDTAARQAAYNVAHNESRVENMEAAFLDILRGWGRSDRALIITGAGGKAGGKDDDQTMDERVATAMRQLRWATPERLVRERSSPNHELMGAFLAEHQLGAAVFCETPMLSVVVGVGVPASHRAFTYPQITQLQELAAIIEGALERTLMVLKIQHTEQLATVGLLGASLAHEIRNPLVSIKAIVQLLPTRYQEE